MIYIFGGFFVFTGIKPLAHREGEIHPERSPVLRLFRRVVRSVLDYRGARFAVKEAGHWYATPLLMVLVVVMATDIVFAVDSIPAIFAILGLRALYFLLRG